jgi:hypothetical protein
MAQAGPPVTLYIPKTWAGRIWARVGCNFNASGACNPPYQPCCLSGSCLQDDGTFGIHCAHSGLAPTSLLEFSLDNPSPNGPYDVYDSSLVDGWSVPLSMEPIAGTYTTTPTVNTKTKWCGKSGCDAAPLCPSELAVNNSFLSCYSPCQAAINSNNYSQHDKDRACCVCTQSHPLCNCQSTLTYGSWYYGCCSGSFGCSPYQQNPTPPRDTVCNPWSTTPGRAWSSFELDYINTVRSACGHAYAWQFDDFASDFSCSPNTESGHSVVDYRIVFVTRLRSADGKHSSVDAGELHGRGVKNDKAGELAVRQMMRAELMDRRKRRKSP